MEINGRGVGLCPSRVIRIIVLGAGPSGLLLAYKILRDLSSLQLQVFEKNADVAGTWHENQYPGCASDLPALNYTYTFAPRYDWSSSYGCSAEIRDYFVDFCDKHDLRKYISTQNKIRGARWLGEDYCWQVEVEDLRSGARHSHECDIFINAGGYLNTVKIPQVPGIDLFQGTLVHSAAWHEEVRVEGKNVALIGNSASGVQLLSAIQPRAKHITYLMRSPTWLLPPLGVEQRSKHLPTTRRQNEAIINAYFSAYFAGSPAQTAALSQYNQAVRSHFPSSLPVDQLIPSDSIPGCKRILSPPSYLQSLRAANVTPLAGTLTSLTPTGFTYTSLPSSETPPQPPPGPTLIPDIDNIILATGFHTHTAPAFPIHGLPSRSPPSQPRSKPPPQESYLGLADPNLPNYFTLLGPLSPTRNGTTLPGLEAQVDYILRMLRRYQQDRSIRSFKPKAEAVEVFTRHWDRWMRARPWVWDGVRREERGELAEGGGESGSGIYPLIWPGTTAHYRWAIRDVRWSDWEIGYGGQEHENRVKTEPPGAGRAKEEGQQEEEIDFQWLGDGICPDQAEERGDYLRESDDMLEN